MREHTRAHNACLRVDKLNDDEWREAKTKKINEKKVKLLFCSSSRRRCRVSVEHCYNRRRYLILLCARLSSRPCVYHYPWSCSVYPCGSQRPGRVVYYYWWREEMFWFAVFAPIVLSRFWYPRRLLRNIVASDKQEMAIMTCWQAMTTPRSVQHRPMLMRFTTDD